MSDRVKLLLARELDGTLTDLERTELEREILLCPEGRRERAAWRKVIGTLAEDRAAAQRLPVERMAAEITKRAATRPVLLPMRRVRRAVLAATLAAAGFALFAVPRPPERPPRAQVEKPVVLVSKTPPVELTFEGREEEVPPITIRF